MDKGFPPVSPLDQLHPHTVLRQSSITPLSRALTTTEVSCQPRFLSRSINNLITNDRGHFLSLRYQVYTFNRLEVAPCQAFRALYHKGFLLTFSLSDGKQIGNESGTNPLAADSPYLLKRTSREDRWTASLPWLHYRALTSVVLSLGFLPRSPWVYSSARTARHFPR